MPRYFVPSTPEKMQTYLTVREFVEWLYEEGPDPDTVTRERLMASYFSWKAEKAMIEGVTRYVPQDGELPLLRPTD